MKKRIFVGSSTESLEVARKLHKAVNSKYKEKIELELWDSFFPLSEMTLPGILERIPQGDGAVFVLTSRDENLDACLDRRPRDNVFLEVGVALARFGLSKVVILKPSEFRIGTDLNAFNYRKISDNPDKEEVDNVAAILYNHFVETPNTASARLGWESFRELELTRALTQGTLTELKCYGNGGEGYDRIRLYLLNRQTESFDGLVELGGVADNFRRVRVPIRTDALSQVLLQQQAVLLHTKNEGQNYVTTYVGEDKYTEPERLPGDRKLTPHDLPSLDRGLLKQWLDIPLIVPDGPDKGKVMGKMTIDNARRDQEEQEKIPLNPCDRQLWQHAEVAADFIARFEREKFPDWDITNRGNLNVDKVYQDAFRLAMLDDQLRTLLAEVRGRFGFDRLRLYLTIKKHMELFGEYLRAVVPGRVAYGECQGFWGHVELGGVRTLFADLIITADLDHCTRICLGAAQGVELPFQKSLQRGEPVIFSKNRQEDSSRPLVCKVPSFYRPAELERETSQEEIPEHLNLPIVFDGQIIGKVTIDNKWTEPNEMRIKETQQEDSVGLLMSYSKKMGDVIAAAEHMPNEDLCEAIIKTLNLDE